MKESLHLSLFGRLGKKKQVYSVSVPAKEALAVCRDVTHDKQGGDIQTISVP